MRRQLPSLDEPFGLEVIVGLECGTHADAIFLTEHTDGGQLVADLQGFPRDHLFQSL
jgi:hypothetical protein